MNESPQLARLLQDADPRLLEGKAIVITGAGGGIGRACAIFAAACGARVVVNDVRSEAAEAVAKEIDASGARAIASHDQVQQWSGAQALIDSCVKTFGSIEGLLNSPGRGDNSFTGEEP